MPDVKISGVVGSLLKWHRHAVPIADVTYASELHFDCSESSTFRVVLTGDIADRQWFLDSPAADQVVTVLWVQDATGGRSVSRGHTDVMHLSGNVTNGEQGRFAINTAPGSTTTTVFQWNADTGYWQQLDPDGSHAARLQLIHLANEGGPMEGFASGAYFEQLPAGDAFPTSGTWYTSSGKTAILLDETLTYNADGTVATQRWRAYATDGATVIATVTDTLTHSAGILATRTRVLS